MMTINVQLMYLPAISQSVGSACSALLFRHLQRDVDSDPTQASQTAATL